MCRFYWEYCNDITTIWQRTVRYEVHICTLISIPCNLHAFACLEHWNYLFVTIYLFTFELLVCIFCWFLSSPSLSFSFSFSLSVLFVSYFSWSFCQKKPIKSKSVLTDTHFTLYKLLWYSVTAELALAHRLVFYFQPSVIDISVKNKPKAFGMTFCALSKKWNENHTHFIAPQFLTGLCSSIDINAFFYLLINRIVHFTTKLNQIFKIFAYKYAKITNESTSQLKWMGVCHQHVVLLIFTRNLTKNIFLKKATNCEYLCPWFVMNNTKLWWRMLFYVE